MLLCNFAHLLSSAMSNGVEHQLSGSNQFKLSQLLSTSSGHTRASDSSWDSDNSCTFPCLLLQGHLSGSDRSGRNISLIDIGALSLANPLNANRKNIDSVPMQLLSNITTSFRQLLISRLRASMIALVNTAVKLGDLDEANVLRRLIGSREPIKISTVVTSFTVLDDDQHPPPGKIMKPIILEATIDAKMLGMVHTVTLQVPGTICAVINSSDYLLQSVDIAFDTIAFLKTMMAQARFLVKKTMKRAVKLASAYTHMKRKRLRSQQDAPSNNEEQQNILPLQSLSQSHLDTTTSTSSQKRRSKSKDHDLMSSYPEHLRETVRQFLPSQDTMAEASIEGFPPQLAKTLKALARGDDFSSSSDEEQNLHNIGDESLQGGISSWVSLSDAFEQKDYGYKNSSSNNFRGPPRPFKKRKSKVSFSMPNN